MLSTKEVVFEIETKADKNWHQRLYFLTHRGISNKNINSDRQNVIGVYDIDGGEIYVIKSNHRLGSLISVDSKSRSLLIRYPIYYYFAVDTSSKEGAIYTIYDLAKDRVRNNFVLDYYGQQYDIYSSDISGPNLYSQLMRLESTIKYSELNTRWVPHIDSNSDITVDPDTLRCDNTQCQFDVRVGDVSKSEFG
jgi:hypothetical protein